MLDPIVVFTDSDGDTLSVVPRDLSEGGDPLSDPIITVSHGTSSHSVMMTDEEFDRVVLALNDLRKGWRPEEERPEPVKVEGWAPPTPGSRKWHYHGPDRRSLCGRWVRLFADDSVFEPDTGPSQNDCAGCRKALDKRKAKEAVHA